MKKFLCVLAIVLAVMASSAFVLACGGNQSGGGQTGDDTTIGGGDVTYTVTWKDENGTTLTTTNAKSGSVPSYTYTKQDTAEWHYTVSGWSSSLGGTALSALPAATGDATYYAVVTKTKRKYTVAYVDADGNAVQTAVEKEYGDTISEPSEKPTKDNMRFIGWCVDKACKTRAEFPITVSGNVTLYAAFVNKVDVKALLARLLDGYKLDPYSYIPDAMLPKYARTVNTSVKAETDYDNFVSKSQMPHNGFGEQWHMITDNLAQSELFFNALKVVETVSTEAVAAFNNYVDKNPDDTAHHEFKHGIYNVTVDCGGDYIYFVLDYTANFPIVGEQNAQIALSMGYDETNKTVRIQLGDANALKYTLTNNGYKFALKLLGIRRAMFEISRDGSGKVTGHINEFLTASGVTDMAKASAADFYISGGYVSAVGNKASGMVAFKGYINELYNATTGNLLGYEVRETQSLAGKSVTFNTLWFDLADISGISSIKYDSSDKKFYVNGSATEFKNKKVGGLSAKTASRRFDIEFRTQYFYVDGEEVEVQVPMLFVQEEVYDDLAKDVKSENSINIAVTVSSANVDKITSDYATLIDAFINNKAEIDVQTILDYIGEKVTF